MTNKQKLNTKEAAAYLGLRPNTLEIWRHHHKGPRYSKMGTRVLYDPDDLEAFFAARAVETMESRPQGRRPRSER